MFEYLVCDYNFNHVGWVKAMTAVDALHAAKNKYPLAIAPMVFQ
jgi:hypothetical protein